MDLYKNLSNQEQSNSIQEQAKVIRDQNTSPVVKSLRNMTPEERKNLPDAAPSIDEVMQKRQSDIEAFSQKYNAGIDITPDQYNFFTQMLAKSDDVERDESKMAQALLYSRNYGFDPQYAMSNLDALNAARLGSNTYDIAGVKKLRNSFKVGDLTVERGRLAEKYYWATMNGKDTSELDTQIQQLDAEIESLSEYAPKTWVGKLLGLSAQTIPYSWHVFTKAAAGGIIGSAIAPGVGTVMGIAGSFSEGYRLTKYSQYYDLVKAGIDPTVANWTSTLSGVVQAAIESIPALSVETRLGLAVTGGAKQLSQQVIERAVANGTMGKIALLASRYLTNAAAEGGEELLQQITEDLTDNIAYELSGMDAPNTSRDVIRNAVESYIGGAGAALILGIPEIALNGFKVNQVAKDLKTDAQKIDSKEAFIKKYTEGEQKETFDKAIGDVSDSVKKDTLSEIYDKNHTSGSTITEAEAKTIAVDLDINEDFVPGDIDSEGKEVEAQPSERGEVVRMNDGRLRVFEDLTKTTENSDGTESHTMQIGSKGSKLSYGHVDYTINEETRTVTIDQVATKIGYENLTRDAILEVERSHEGWNIEWNPETDAQIKVKEQLIKDSPNKTLQWFDNGTDVETNIKVGKWIRDNFKNLTKEQSVVAAKLIEFTAQSQGKDTNTWINDHIQNLDTTDAKGVKGATQFDESDTKAIIYAGKNADFSTFSHEVFHTGIKVSQSASKLAAALREASNTEQFVKYINSHQQIIKMNSDKVLSVIKDMGDNPHEWTVEQHEVTATLFESYLRDGKTFSEKLKNIFAQIADWFRRIYKSMKFEGMLNDNIIKAYDEFLAGNPQTRNTVENNRLNEYSNSLYQSENKIDPETLTFNGKSFNELSPEAQSRIKRLLPLAKITFTTNENGESIILAGNSEAMKIALEFVKNENITNRDSGNTGIITGTTQNEIASNKSSYKSLLNGFDNYCHFTAGANLKMLFERAVLSESRNDRNNDRNIKAIHIYSVAVDFGEGDVGTVQILAKEVNNKDHLYSLEIAEIGKLSPKVWDEVDIIKLLPADSSNGARLSPLSNNKYSEDTNYVNRLNQTDVTETDNFKKWFGDSKVVNEDGSPKVVYHGSIKRFDAFNESDKGIYFTDNKDAAESYGMFSEPYAVYLKAENPYILDFDGGIDTEETDTHYALEDEVKKAFEAGYDSVIAYNTFDGENELNQYIVKDPTQIKSVNNNGQFDPENPNIYYQLDDDTQVEDVKGTLVVTHNLTEDNIKGIVEIGGMPMPSLAITKPDVDITNFGNITLVGDKKLADKLIKDGSVYNRDIWSPTVPRPKYKINKKALSKFDEWNRSINLNSTDTLMSYQKNTPEDLANYYSRENNLRLEYCKEKGIKVEIPYKEVQYGFDERLLEAARKWQKDNEKSYYLNYDDTGALYEAVKSVADTIIKEKTEQLEKLDIPKFKKNLFQSSIDNFKSKISPDNFSAMSNLLLTASSYEKGKTEVDEYKLKDILDKKAPQKDVESWLKETKFSGIFSDPMIKNGKSYVPYNVENIFNNMVQNSDIGNAGNSITYSNSLASSFAARRLNNRQEIAEQEDFISPDAPMDVDDVKAVFDEYHDEALKRYKYKDTWAGLDDANKVIAQYLALENKTDAKLKSLFAKLDFTPSDDLMSETHKLVDAIEGMRRRYFEAKPHEIMQFSDFKYAIVPSETSNEVKSILGNAGLQVVESDNRQEALQKIADRDSEILFQLDKEIENEKLDSAKAFETKEEFILFENSMSFGEPEFTDEELGDIWDRAHNIIKDQKTGEYSSPVNEFMSEEEKDDTFRSIMNSDEGIKAFIDRGAEAFGMRSDVNRHGGRIEAYTEDEYQEFIQAIQNADRIQTEAAPYITALMQRNQELSPEAIKKVRGMIMNSLRDYRDLYAQVLGDENFAAGVYNDYMPDIKDTRSSGMRITQRKDLVKRLEGQEIIEAVRRGTEKYNGDVEKVIAVYDKEIADLNSKIQKLEQQSQSYYLKMTVEEKENFNKQQKIKKMESAITRERQNIRTKLDSGVRVSTEQLSRLNGWEDELNLLHEEVKQLRKQDRVNAALSKKEALDNLKEELKQKQKNKANAEEAHRYKRGLYNNIMRKPSDSIDYAYAEKILAIQAIMKDVIKYQNDTVQINGKTMKLSEFRTAVESGEIQIEGLSDYQLKRYLTTSLADFTINDLETLNDTVAYYEKMGRQMWQAKVDKRAYEVQMKRNQFIEDLMKNPKYKASDTLPESKESQEQKKRVRNVLSMGYIKSLNMNRKFQMLSNHTEGPMWQFAVQRKRELQNQEFAAKDARLKPLEAKRKELGVKWEDVYQTVPMDLSAYGFNMTQTYTVSDLIYGLMAQYDEQNKYAFAYGNLVSQDEKRYLNHDNKRIESLGNKRNSMFVVRAEAYMQEHPQIWELAKAFDKDFQSQAPRLNALSIDQFNQPMRSVEHYLPIFREEFDGTELTGKMVNDLFNRNAGKGMTNPEKGMLKERIDISPDHQKPTQLDFFGTWFSSMNDQEHLIHTLPYVRELNAVFKNRASDLRNAIINTYGQPMLQDIDNYINEIANPNLFSDTQGINFIFKALRGPLYTGYLGYRISSAVTQLITSPAAFLQEVSPIELAKGLLKMTAQPSKTWAYICQLSPDMEHRSLDPVKEEIDKMAKQSNSSKVKKAYAQFLEFGTIGLEMADRWAVGGGWLACFEKKLNEFENQSDPKAIEEAVKYANNVVRNTQPMSDVTEIAPIFKSKSEAAKAFTQFQVSLNVIWNNIVYDNGVKLAHNLKNKEINSDVKKKLFGKAVGCLTGYAFAGALLTMVQNGKDDDDEPEDIIKELVYGATTQFTSAVPFLSSKVDNLVQGAITGEKGYEYQSSLYPALDKVFSGVSGLVTLDKDDKNYQERFLRNLLNIGEGAGLMLGVPTSGFKELGYTFTEEGLKESIVNGDFDFTFNPGAVLGRRNY